MSFYGSGVLNNGNYRLPDVDMDVFNQYYEIYSETLGLDQTYISEGKVANTLNNLINDKENYNRTDVDLDNISVEDLKDPKRFRELKQAFKDEHDEKKKKKITKQLIAIFGSYLASMATLALAPLPIAVIAVICQIAIDISVMVDSVGDGSKTEKEMIIKRLENLKKKVSEGAEGKEKDKRIEKIEKTIDKLEKEM